MDEVEDFKWVKLTNTMGLSAAEVIAGRLKAENIPAWVWQQGAGGAMGLTVGPLGFGHVMVPEHLEEEAQQIIEEEYEIPESQFETDLDDEEYEGEPGKISVIAKGLLLFVALIFNLPAVIFAFIIALFASPADEHVVTCPYCGCELELSPEEISRNRYLCPDCDQEVHIKE